MDFGDWQYTFCVCCVCIVCVYIFTLLVLVSCYECSPNKVHHVAHVIFKLYVQNHSGAECPKIREVAVGEPVKVPVEGKAKEQREVR